VGAEQQGQFTAWAQDTLLPALRDNGRPGSGSVLTA
jgi:hypothetical protein